MPQLSLSDTQAVAELADALYSFLPGSGAAYTWNEVAQQNHVGSFWIGGSKLPAITHFFEATFENRRGAFCDIILTGVRQGMKYRIKKQDPVRREEVERINALLLRLQFKIPELNDASFLKGLPSSGSASTPTPAGTGAGFKDAPPDTINALRQQFLKVFCESNPVRRGFEFELFLNEFFHAHGLTPRGSFRVAGEQIDGSFEWQGSVFLVEARWRATQANTADLLVLRGKAEKSEWTRGLFISMNGFSDTTSETLRIGRKANLIGMSGQDLSLILEQHWNLLDALRVKLRHTGETGEAYLPLAEAKR